jgi:hypothetical protein
VHRAGTPRAIAAAMERSTKLRGRCHGARTLLYWCPALLLVASFLGCAGLAGSEPAQPPPSTVTVTVVPSSASVPLGEPQTFTATVSNSANTAVTWSVNGIPGGNATVGTIDASGVYMAPEVLTASPSISLTATSVADPSKSATGTITIASLFSLAVSGPSSVKAGNTATYTATLIPAAGSNPSRAISWSVAGTGCTGAACGAISSSGIYSAPSIPPSLGTVQIVATPQADPSKAASLAVSIIAVIGISISPASAAVPLGAAQAFQAAVTGARNTTVTWDVNGIAGGNATVGSIVNSPSAPDTATYTAPQILPGGGSVIVHATSNTNPIVSASATLTFNTSINVTLSPAIASLTLNERQTFSVHVNNTANQNVIWFVNGIAAGNSLTGEVCATGSNPCQPVLTSAGGSVDYIAPAGLPTPNPAILTATSQADGTASASASITILAHIGVSVQPASATIALTGKLQFAASVTGTENSQVTWSITGAGCGQAGVCGSIDSAGLYTAPTVAPTPALLDVVATSSADKSQSGTAAVTISSGPGIFSLSPSSAYAGSAGGFTLLVSGNNLSPSAPGPGSTILVGGTPRVSFCGLNTQCITSLAASDLQSAGNLPVQLENPDGTISNTLAFVVLAPGAGTGTISLTPSAPTSVGNDIIVVELSTNGGSGAAGNVSLNVAAIGPYTAATSSCVLGGSPVILQSPATGTGTADVCVFSVSGLDPSFTYTISGPPVPDISVINREPLGLGILHLTLSVPATAAPGPRTLFVENPEGDKAAGTGAIEVR